MFSIAVVTKVFQTNYKRDNEFLHWLIKFAMCPGRKQTDVILTFGPDIRMRVESSTYSAPDKAVKTSLVAYVIARHNFGAASDFRRELLENSDACHYQIREKVWPDCYWKTEREKGRYGYTRAGCRTEGKRRANERGSHSQTTRHSGCRSESRHWQEEISSSSTIAWLSGCWSETEHWEEESNSSYNSTAGITLSN